jgi:pilus assembly protein Flp/PilA
MTKFISRFAKDESGATAIEYGLIAALIAVVIITVLTTIGGNLRSTLEGSRQGSRRCVIRLQGHLETWKGRERTLPALLFV